MFAQWVTTGAQIGITAFFAVVVFLMAVAVLMGLFTMLMQLFRLGDEE